MKRVALFLLSLGSIAHGQDRFDTLWQTWEDRTLADSVRLTALNRFIWDGPRLVAPDSAYVLSRMMYDTAAHWGLHRFMVGALNTQARLKAMQGDHSTAMEIYQQALELCRSNHDVKREIVVLGNIGGSYFEMNEPYNALQVFRRALELSGSVGDRAEAHLRTSMALAHTQMAEYEEADEQARRGLAVAEKIGDKGEILYAVRILADNLDPQGRMDEAIPYYERSLALSQELREQRSVLSALKGLASAYSNRGDNEKAIAFGKRALDIAQELDDRTRIMNCYSILYRVYKQAGNAAEALGMLEKYLESHDRVMNDENKAAMVRQKAQFEFDLKEATLRAEQEKKDAIAAQEIRRQKVVRYSFMAGALLILAGGGIWFRTDRKHRLERFQKEAAELQTQVLRSQMNPHFIFNALNSINAFVQRNDADGASSYLSKFARVMRGVLENSRHREVALQDDLETLRGYMELEQKRMENKFDFTIEVDEDIDPEQVMVPPLVLQPLVENAIWHGIAAKEGLGHISVKVEQQGDQLIWCIEDDGVGRGAAKPVAGAEGDMQVNTGKKTSLGTAITRSRLELFQQQFGGRAGFRYEDLPQGTRVVVEMPVIRA
ncbi:MAG: tetratricopeptide repeat protein [Flavobacteriales bacterium]|nr:tetratricopeptide repeat protein [Flavobacteriales bacterium]